MKSVYIHIPFCKNICTYCDFCKMFYNDKYVSKYLDNLDKEIKERYMGDDVRSIYIGGGTPSCLRIDELERLLEIVSVFKLNSDYEYTIECNIENIDIDKINLFKSYGVNRISFGVESFDKDIQEILGRCHDEEMIFDNIYMTKKYFDNINVDLIYGVTEDVDKVKSDIDKFLELDVTHVSCYSLILEENTKLYIDNKKYISEDIDREMYDYINNKLTSNGYIHYEVSNYAKEGYESIHNKCYWKNLEYYGFGLGAVSYLDNYRINNTKNMSKYLDGIYEDSHEYEDIDIRKETDLMLGFRLMEGIDVLEFNKKYNDNLLDKEVIKELLNDGYLEVNEDMLRCKREYIYLLNNILERIIGSDL